MTLVGHLAQRVGRLLVVQQNDLVLFAVAEVGEVLDKVNIACRADSSAKPRQSFGRAQRATNRR